MVRKKLYPSQERYNANNPSVSFRLPKEEKKKLEKIAERDGKTIGEYVRDFLKGIVVKREKEITSYNRGFKDGYARGFDKGYEQGKEDWQIWFKCSECGEPCYIRPNDKAHKEILKGFVFFGWAHKSCIAKKEKSGPLLGMAF
jgi:hypothetical protein